MAVCGRDSGILSEGEKLLFADKYGLETYKVRQGSIIWVKKIK